MSHLSFRSALLLTAFGSACSRETSVEHGPALRETSVIATPVALTQRAPANVVQQGDTTPIRRAAARPPVLTEAEQRVVDVIVFAPRMTTRFLVAARNRHLLVDIGRLDLGLDKKNSEQLALVRRVSARVGPLAHVPKVMIRGTWGAETDSIVSYDVWNGRVVAVLGTSLRTDSLLRRNVALVGVASTMMDVPATPPASATGAPSTQAPAAAACVRDTLPASLPARVASVRDSLVRWVTDSLKAPYERLVKATSVRGEATTGCFGAWRAVVIVTSRTPSFEWSEERAALVSADGGVQSARVRDLRLRAHDSLMAFDADGDGIDELAARGLATRMGAQSVLKLDASTRRFARFASGFAWETR